MLLCDAAQSIEGKLYVLGGGWSRMAAETPTNMSLAVKLSVPWSQANRPISVRASLFTEDGNPVDLGAGPVEITGEIEVGRPPGMVPGTSLDAPFVLNFPSVVLPLGGYVWQLDVDGEEASARAPFQAYGQGQA